MIAALRQWQPEDLPHRGDRSAMRVLPFLSGGDSLVQRGEPNFDGLQSLGKCMKWESGRVMGRTTCTAGQFQVSDEDFCFAGHAQPNRGHLRLIPGGHP